MALISLLNQSPSDLRAWVQVLRNRASDSRPMRLRLRAELFLASFAVREESIRSEEGGGAYISKYIKGILKSRLSRREQSRWNIIDDTTSMAFFEEFSSLNPVFHTFLFYGRLPSPFSRVRNTSPHLSIHKKALPRGERKLQDEYALDSRIHSRPDPLWNFRNLQKHSRKGLVMIFSKITRCWSGRRSSGDP